MLFWGHTVRNKEKQRIHKLKHRRPFRARSMLKYVTAQTEPACLWGLPWKKAASFYKGHQSAAEVNKIASKQRNKRLEQNPMKRLCFELAGLHWGGGRKLSWDPLWITPPTFCTMLRRPQGAPLAPDCILNAGKKCKNFSLLNNTHWSEPHTSESWILY